MKLQYLLLITHVFGGLLQLDLNYKSNNLKKRDDGKVELIPNYEPDQGEYFVELEFGSNKENFTVIIDTGSADLWIPSVNANCSVDYPSDVSICPINGYNWKNSVTFNLTSEDFNIHYDDGTVASGFFAQDTVWVGNIEVKDTIFGIANKTDSSATLGIGLPVLEAGHKESNKTTYPNFPQKLKLDGITNRVLYSIMLNHDHLKSSLLFGAVDHAKYLGELVTLPVVTNSDLQSSMVVQLDSIELGTKESKITLVSENSNVQFDTGSTYSSFKPSFLKNLTQQLGGEEMDNVYFVNETAFNETELYFSFQNKTFAVPIMAQLTGPNQNTLLYNNLPENSDLDIILGQDFMTQIYAVFDLEGLEVSIAPQSGSSKSDIQVVGADGNFTKQSGDASETSGDSSEKSGASSIKNVSIYLLVVSALFGLF
ncbi:Candidapepsin-10 [Candida tropicalis]